MTMFDPRTKLSEQVVDEVRRFFGEVVYDVIIPRTVRLSEAPGFGQPITVYDPRSKGADSYRKLAKEVAGRPRPDAPMPVFDELPTVVVSKPTADETAPAADEADPPEHRAEGFPPAEVQTPAAQPESEAPIAETEAGLEQPSPDPEPPVKAETSTQPVLATDALPAPPAPDVAHTPDVAQTRNIAHAEDGLWEDAARTERKVRPPRAAVAPGELPERRVVVIAEDSEIDIEAAKEPLVQVPNGRVSAEDGRAAADIGGTLQDEGESPKRRWRLFRKGGG
jgi:hypothetical protein